MAKYSLFIAGCLLSLSLIGCATVMEGAKGVAGLSTRSLEEARKDAVTKIFNHSYDVCFDKTEKALNNMGTYIYARDRKNRLIAIYISELDTTPVGIFFKPIDSNTTQIEVSSPSTYGREHISKRLFAVLEKLFNPKEKEEKEDGKENKKN